MDAAAQMEDECVQEELAKEHIALSAHQLLAKGGRGSTQPSFDKRFDLFDLLRHFSTVLTPIWQLGQAPGKSKTDNSFRDCGR